MRKTSSHVNEDVAEEKEEEAMLVSVVLFCFLGGYFGVLLGYLGVQSCCLFNILV